MSKPREASEFHVSVSSAGSMAVDLLIEAADLSKQQVKQAVQKGTAWLAPLVLISLILSGCGSAPKVEPVTIPKEEPVTIPEGINIATWERIEAWRNLIAEGKKIDDQTRLTQANWFVNQLMFVDDIDHWGREDYWATPIETLVSGGGDCEDFSLTKYFTLLAMGVEESKLRITYVKAASIDKPHMVVSYYPQPGAVPLVLDNLNPEILPATHRRDLLPVYSFNLSGLWLAKRNGLGVYVDNSDRMKPWRRLLQRLDVEAAELNDHICRYQYFRLNPSEAASRCPRR